MATTSTPKQQDEPTSTTGDKAVTSERKSDTVAASKDENSIKQTNGAYSSSERMYGVALVLLLGLCMSSIVSCVGFLYKFHHDEKQEEIWFLNYIPDLTFEQCLSLCGVTMMGLAAFIYQLRRKIQEVNRLLEAKAKKTK